MLVTPEKREIVGTLPGETQTMRLDENALAHLQSLLGKGIYNDPEMAVIREYACNARDAQDEAGNTAPIEIFLPNTLSPFLRIIDQGIGLDWDDIVNVYSKYGASTKRVEGNCQTGSLGIGAKSALAYCDQYTVVGTKDGVKTIVSVSVDEDSVGTMTKVATEETDEPNGVEISVPAKRWHEFSRKCTDLFQYWPEGSVLVNSEAPTRFTESSYVQKISDTLYLNKGGYGQKSYIIMANVPYPVDNDVFGLNLPYDHQLIAYVGIDAVDFAGSREALRMTSKTKAALAQIGEDFRRELEASIQADIDSAATPVEAIRKALQWYNNTPEGMRPKQFLYKGQEIPTKFHIGDADEDGVRPKMIVVNRSSSKLNAHEKRDSIPFATALDAVWFTDYTLQFTSGHKRRLNEWCSQNGVYPQHFILVEAVPDTTYLESDRVRDWEEVRSIKMPNQQRTDNGRLIGSYDVLTNRDYETEILAEDIDDAEPIYYFIGEANNNSRWKPSRRQLAVPYHRLLRTIEPNCSTVLIPSTRLAKLLRTFPDAQPVQDAVQGLFEEWLKGLSDEDKTALWVYTEHRHAWDNLTRLDKNEVHDPAVKTAIELTENSVQIAGLARDLEKYQSVGNQCHYAGGKRIQLEATWDNPLEAYPLAFSEDRYSRAPAVNDHLYMYMNAAYAAKCVEESIEEQREAA